MRHINHSVMIWHELSKIESNVTLCELILLEKFKSCIPDRIVVYFNEQKVTFLSQASVCAE